MIIRKRQALKSRRHLCLAVLLGLSVVILGFSCEDQPQPRVDPCLDAQPFTADFTFMERVGDSLVISDSVLFYNFVMLEAPGYYYSYEWKIGGDERTFTDRRVWLRFLDDAVGQIPVRLIATGPPSTECYGDINDDGIDTVEHTLHVIAWNDSPMIGKYQGYFASDPSDEEQIVEIKYISPQEDICYEPFGGFELLNVEKGCIPYPVEKNSNLWNSITRGSRAMKFDAYRGNANFAYENCNAPSAWLALVGGDTLKVDFTYGEPGTNNRYPDTFTGIRID